MASVKWREAIVLLVVDRMTAMANEVSKDKSQSIASSHSRVAGTSVGVHVSCSGQGHGSSTAVRQVR